MLKVDAYLKKGYDSLIENIKILLYKEDPDIFLKIEFDNDTIYQEPFLFAYFNNSSGEIKELENLLFGYVGNSLRPKKLSIRTDKYGRYYFPNYGWVITDRPNTKIFLANNEDTLIIDKERNPLLFFEFEPLEYIENTSIELIKYSTPLLESFFFDSDSIIVDVEIKNITRIHRQNINKAFELIRTFSEEQYSLIAKFCPKVQIFDVNTYLRNSFASLSVQGIGFFNAYQIDYNEVFFVDDIAHQTGHAIFNILTYEVENYIAIDYRTTIQSLQLQNNLTENRDVHTLFHALYTYYTSFMCINACIEAGIWHQHRLHEAMGRVAFYLGKCHQDLIIVENFNNKKPIFKEDGTKIYLLIKEKYKEMLKKYGDKCKNYSMANQPYNFTYSKFLEANPI